MRLGRVRSRRACFSVCHPEPRSPQRPSRRTPILPTHFRFAGFTTERRFARVARSEVEGPALLSVILSGGSRGLREAKSKGLLFCLSLWAEVAAATESKDPYTAHPLSLRRFYDGAEVRALREAKSKGLLFCLSSWAEVAAATESKNPILPTHFRFAGFSTVRRFARVSRIGTVALHHLQFALAAS